MADYDNTNRGSIWKNEKREKDTHPDFTGSLNVAGVEYWVSAWKRKDGASPKAPALSFSVKPKDEQQRPAAKSADPISSGRVIAAGGGRPTKVYDDMDDDTIPF